MAIKISLPADHPLNPFKVAIPEAYVRLTRVGIDFAQKQLVMEGGIWMDQDSRLNNGNPIAQIPPIVITKDARQPQWGNVEDPAKPGNVKLDADGKPVMVQVSPAMPSYDEAEVLIKAAMKADQDYRAVGYAMLKKFGFIKDNNPVDVV